MVFFQKTIKQVNRINGARCCQFDKNHQAFAIEKNPALSDLTQCNLYWANKTKNQTKPKLLNRFEKK